MRLRLSLACGDYEITRALTAGDVEAEGLDLVCMTDDTERIYRTERRAECDVAEYNLFAFLREWDAGEDIAAIPVFPHRRFRLGSIFVPAGSPVTEPAGLAGARIGIGGYRPAAAVWLRGILEDHYGVDAGSLRWYDVFGLAGEVPGDLPGPLPAEDPMSRFAIDAYLESGQLDAMLSAYIPAGVAGGRVRRLFERPDVEERAYYRQTGVFPIMHVVTVKRSVLDRWPWVAPNLFRAFGRAKQDALHRLRNPRTLPLAFAQSAWRDQEELLGPDPWQYGLTPGNTRTLELAVRYAVAQGYLREEVAPEDLFVPVDRETPPGFEIR